MRIPDEALKCVVFIGRYSSIGEMSFYGTAFLVGHVLSNWKSPLVCVVTARHIIQQIQSGPNFDGKVLLRVNFKDGTSETLETDVNEWKYHPNEDEMVDVAVLPLIELPEDADVVYIHPNIFLNEEKRSILPLTIGEEVFFTGLFANHKGKVRNIPIARFGNLASLQEERVLTKMGLIDAYLVDAHSIGGLSGAPVFVNYGIVRVEGGRLLQSQEACGKIFLLGLMHGHFMADITIPGLSDRDRKKLELVNFGISIVIPGEKILEVMEQPIIKEKVAAIEAEYVESQLPSMDNIQDEDNEVLTEVQFTNVLKLASRKISEPDQETKET